MSDVETLRAEVDGGSRALEDRAEPRYVARIHGSLLWGGGRHDLVTVNVSQGGLLIFLSKAEGPAFRQVVRVRLALPPSGEVLVSSAIVAHAPQRREQGVCLGLRLVALDGAKLAPWHRFLAQLALGGLPMSASEELGEVGYCFPLQDYVLRMQTVAQLQSVVSQAIATQTLLVRAKRVDAGSGTVRVHLVHPETDGTVVLTGRVNANAGGPGLTAVDLELGPRELIELSAFAEGADATASSGPGAESPEVEDKTIEQRVEPHLLAGLRNPCDSATQIVPARALSQLVDASKRRPE